MPGPLDPRAVDAINPATRGPATDSEFERRLATLERALASSSVGTPPSAGDLKMLAYASPPAGWLLCQGQAISRVTFSVLFTAIGTTYGVGDGSTTFNVPDLVGRMALGAGTAANPTPAGATAHTLGAKGGEEKHTLITAELASHLHDFVPATHTTAAGADTTGTGSPPHNGVSAGTSWTTLQTSPAGSGTAHNVLPPFTVVNFAIKT